MKPETMSLEEFKTQTSDVDRKLFELIQKHKGSISAEHGIGLLKKAALSYTKSPEEIRLMKEIKNLLDPKNLLNPNKIL
jgi:FAD/FMN-containing dehydrogenase